MKLNRNLAEKIVRNSVGILEQGWLLLLAFFSAMLMAPLFTMRSANPYHISNSYGTAFNPDNNFLTVAFIIIMTPLLFYLFQRMRRVRHGNTGLKITTALVLLGFYFFAVLLPTHVGYYSPPDGGLNVFHVAEQVSPAQAFLRGKGLYSEIIFLRGGGIDVLFPAAGFKLLGNSLGAFMIASDMYRVIAFLSFSLLLGLIIRHFALYGALLVFFVGTANTSIFEFRDTFVWLAFGLVMYAFRAGTVRRRQAAFVMLGIIAGLTPLLVIDRGVLLFAVTGLLLVALPLFSLRGSLYEFAPKGYLKQAINALPLLGGLVFGFLLPLLFLGMHGYDAYLKLTFHDIPRYAGLLVSMPFPDAFGPQYQIWGPAYIAITLILLLTALYKYHRYVTFSDLIPLTFITVFAIVCLKMGTNRIDINKMATVTAPLFLVVLLLIWHSIAIIREHRMLRQGIVPFVVLCLATVVLFSRFTPAYVVRQPHYSRGDLKSYLTTPSRADSSWLSPEMTGVTDYIREHTTSKDYIYAFTSDPIYYYLTERQNPSRMYINWYNDPQPYTDETLQRLKATQPKVIIYEEKTWMDAPDTMPMQVRLPEIDKWIAANYHYRHTIGNTTLLTRQKL